MLVYLCQQKVTIINFLDYEKLQVQRQNTLGIPNREIRLGLYKSLLTNYLGVRPTQGTSVVAEMQTARYLYLIEVKLNQSAQAAMEQIDLKEYAKGFSLSTLPIVKVGVNFNQKQGKCSESLPKRR